LAKGASLIIAVLAEEVANPTTLLIAGLVSGSGVIALVVKFLIASPERETSAYKQGGADEHARNEDEIKELKQRNTELYKEISELRTGMLRLAVATELSASQKKEIANILGFKSITQMNTEARQETIGDKDE
jgi:hypothetical protein